AGTIVASGDPGALLDAVGHLVADPLRADLIGARGPLYCQAHLSEKVALDAYEAWVRDLHHARTARKALR
ncbi:MAG: hypothetical protein J2O46_07235, partial [Nocardioides sp.]|nr:hypothetical protein [Nocardioides sp.]